MMRQESQGCPTSNQHFRLFLVVCLLSFTALSLCIETGCRPHE